MSFLVRVAVFPVRISFTNPRFSQAIIFLTKRLSFFMISTEKAIEIETARGSPSGIATIIIVNAVVKILRNSIKVSVSNKDPEMNIFSRVKADNVAKIAKPAMYPHFPMYPASFSSLSYNGVNSSSCNSYFGKV